MYQPRSDESMWDSNGAKNNNMSTLIKNILYNEKPNIVLPLLQLPLQASSARFSEHVKGENLLDDSHFIKFNSMNPLKKSALRHSFFFSGMDTLRNNENESASYFMQHIDTTIFKGSQASGHPFERGYYSNYRGLVEPLPVPFPRFFTPLRLTEKGILRSPEEKL